MAKHEGDKRIRLMLVEHHAHLRAHIHTLLAHEPMFDVAADMESGVEAVNEARRLKPDVIVMDMVLPDADGLTMTQVFRKLLPNSPVILLACTTDYRQAAMECGASAIVVKHEAATHLIPTLKRVGQRLREENAV
jgi:DNA-binding NarL/FixJ family response regulator